MIIACPHCAGLNRVALEKLSQQAVCGKCKSPLITQAPIELNLANFANHAQKSEVPLEIGRAHV